MGRYYYPNAKEPLEAKKQFLREHHHKISHCFRNAWGTGYVLFDTKEDVNTWWKEKTGKYFYKEEYEPGTTFTEDDALREIEKSYGSQIDNVLRNRQYSMPMLAIGLPFSYSNSMFLAFVKSSDESDITYRFYLHYDAYFMDVNSSTSNSTIRTKLIKLIYEKFYDSQFKKRIEGSKKYNSSPTTPTNIYKPTTLVSRPQPKSSPKPNPQQPTYSQPSYTPSSDSKASMEAGCAGAGFFGMGGLVLLLWLLKIWH